MTAALRQAAVAIFHAAVRAAHPGKATASALEGEEWRKPVTVLAFGKAAPAMATAAVAGISGDEVHGEVPVVTDTDAPLPDGRMRVMKAGHPLPDAAGLSAARYLAHRLRTAPKKGTVLALVSGGSSALLPAPVPGVTLADKIATTNLLLNCGAGIREVNTVRKHLSTLKGGGMLRLSRAARVHSLILSDVFDDDPGVVGSGPTVPDPTTFGDALGVVESFRLGGLLTPAVLSYLRAGEAGHRPETLKPGDPQAAGATHRLIGGNAVALKGAGQEATRLGYRAHLVEARLAGEARVMGEFLAATIPNIDRPAALLWGGETVVTVKGHGQGGRCQELALAFALKAGALRPPWALLAAGTDGRDGPTEAAGAFIDPGTANRIRRAGLSPEMLLADNDSYRALRSSGDIFVTQPTGTNVADLVVLLLGQ